MIGPSVDLIPSLQRKARAALSSASRQTPSGHSPRGQPDSRSGSAHDVNRHRLTVSVRPMILSTSPCGPASAPSPKADIGTIPADHPMTGARAPSAQNGAGAPGGCGCSSSWARSPRAPVAVAVAVADVSLHQRLGLDKRRQRKGRSLELGRRRQPDPVELGVGESRARTGRHARCAGRYSGRRNVRWRSGCPGQLRTHGAAPGRAVDHAVHARRARAAQPVAVRRGEDDPPHQNTVGRRGSPPRRCGPSEGS